MRDMGLDAVMFSASSQITSRGSLRYLFGYYMPVFEEYLVIFQKNIEFNIETSIGIRLTFA